MGSLFAALHCLHLFFEWVLHPFRATGIYYRNVRRLVAMAPAPLRRFLRVILLTAQPEVTEDEWACFMALDTALRSYILVFSLFVYMGGYTWLRFGYNRMVFQYSQSVSHEHYITNIIQ